MIARPIQDTQRKTKEAHVCTSVTKNRTLANAFLQTRTGNAPQAEVAGHCFGAGLLLARQLPPPVEHTTAPLGPEPALMPHLVGQPVGSLRVQAVGEGRLCVVCMYVCEVCVCACSVYVCMCVCVCVCVRERERES